MKTLARNNGSKTKLLWSLRIFLASMAVSFVVGLVLQLASFRGEATCQLAATMGSPVDADPIDKSEKQFSWKINPSLLGAKDKASVIKRRKNKEKPAQKKHAQKKKKPAHKKPARISPKAGTVKLGAVSESENIVDLERKLGVTLDFKANSPRAPRCTDLSPDQVTFSLVTQSSDNRLWVMEEQCKRWKGPISIAVTTERSNEQVMDELVGKLGCSRDQITLSVRKLTDKDKNDYPVNVMRNLAISSIKTTHFINLDIDFMISDTLESSFQRQEVRQAFSEDPKLAAVVPAFELLHVKNKKDTACNMYSKYEAEVCQERAMGLMPFSFENLLKQTEAGNVTRFVEKKSPKTHGSTNYKDWFAKTKSILAGDDSAGMFQTIQCVKAFSYEPYLAIRYCQDTPPFQEQFTGYGFNKVSWLLQVRLSGYKFKQLAGAYITHFPHDMSSSRRKWAASGKKTKGMTQIETKKGKSDRIFVEFYKWMHDNLPIVKKTKNCKKFAHPGNNLWVPDEVKKEAFKRA